MNKSSIVVVGALIALGLTHMAQASATVAPGVESTAKVTKEQASATALARVGSGEIKSAELEKERGRLVWSFDIAQPGKSGVTEVQVDARTGKIVAIEHESAAAESNEAKAERTSSAKH